MRKGNRVLSLPIIQGGMGIGVSLGKLAGAVAKQGGMGVVSTANPGFREVDFWDDCAAANSRVLRAQLLHAREIAGENGMVAINAMAATRDYAQAVQTALEAGVDAIISGAGLPLNLPELAHGFDVLLAPIVSGGRAASLICRTWLKKHNRLPDFVVLEGSGAGGHLGFSVQDLEQGAKPLEVLFTEVQQALAPFGNIPLFVAGSVFSGAEVAAWLRKGAAGVQIATRFIATHECDASQAYKEILLRAKADDICIVKSPVGMPGRALRSPLMQRLEQEGRIPPQKCAHCLLPCNPAQSPYCITRALIDAVEGKWDTGLFFCGENAGRVNEIVSVAQLLDELTREAKESGLLAHSLQAAQTTQQTQATQAGQVAGKETAI